MTAKASASHLAFPIILSLAGLLVLVEGWKLLAQVMECRRWIEIDALVQRAEVREIAGGKKRFLADITYTYTVGGTTHTSQQVLLQGDWAARHKSQVVEMLQDYPVGKTVKAYHDASHSGQVILIRPDITGVYVLFGAGGVLFGAGVYFVVGCLRKRGHVTAKPPEHT